MLRSMPIIRACLTPGCATLTMGDRCIDHEQPTAVNAIFARGRPFRSDVSNAPDPEALERGRLFRLNEAAPEPAPRSAA